MNVGLTLLQFRGLFSAKQREIADKKDELLALHLSDPEAYNQIYTEYLERYGEYQSLFYKYIYADEKTIVKFENRYLDYEDYGDIKLFQELQSAINRPDEYKNKITSLIRESALRLKG